MKTAMQELYDWVEKRDFYISKEWLKVLLEKEKQQIIEAQSYAICNADMTNNKGYFDCEKYYNETYKQD